MTENVLPTFTFGNPTTTESTQINIVIPIFSEYTVTVFDWVLLSVGSVLNFLIVLVITSNKSMRTSSGCYLLSLASSNMIVLLDPFEHVIRTIFHVDIKPNLDYVFHVSFDVSILTIVVLALERYIVICHRRSPLPQHDLIVEISTALKGVFFIWFMSVMITSMELNLYRHVEREIALDIYVSTTILFLILPCLLLLLLEGLILYDLIIWKTIEGCWRYEDVDDFSLIAGLTFGFAATRVPYRLSRVIVSLMPTAPCCTPNRIALFYTAVKMSTVLLPVICIVTSLKLRRALQDTLFCRACTARA